MSLIKCVLVQVSSWDYEAPDCYVHVVRKYEVEDWYSEAVIVDEHTANRWRATQAAWVAMQKELDDMHTFTLRYRP